MNQHIVTTEEIRTAWNLIQGNLPFLSSSSRQSTFEANALVRKWRGNVVNKWIGCSGEQMQGWLAEGYYPSEGDIPEVNFSNAPVHKRRFVSNDEAGELQIDAALAGDDYIYRAYTNREVPRNINVHIDTCFSASTNSRVIAQYLEWCLRLVEALQKRGLAPGLSLEIATQRMFRERGDWENVVIPLSQAGEQIDSIAWRAYFTEGGFRTLGFLSMGIAGDKLGLTVSSGLGTPHLRSKFSVEFDEDTSTLHITSPNSPHTFNADEMNALVEAAGVL